MLVEYVVIGIVSVIIILILGVRQIQKESDAGNIEIEKLQVSDMEFYESLDKQEGQ